MSDSEAELGRKVGPREALFIRLNGMDLEDWGLSRFEAKTILDCLANATAMEQAAADAARIRGIHTYMESQGQKLQRLQMSSSLGCAGIFAMAWLISGDLANAFASLLWSFVCLMSLRSRRQ